MEDENDSGTTDDGRLVSGHSWVWYKGYDLDNELHVYKIFALKGERENPSVTIGLKESERDDFLRKARRSDLKDEYLIKHPYWSRIKSFMREKEGGLYVMDVEMYNLWRKKTDDDDGVGSRIYFKGELQSGVKRNNFLEDEENQQDLNEETDVSGGTSVYDMGTILKKESEDE